MGAGAAVRARFARPALPACDGRVGPGLLGDTTTGSSFCAAGEVSAGAAYPRGVTASVPSTISEEENQNLERGDCAKLSRSRDAERHPTMLMKDTKIADGERPIRQRIALSSASPFRQTQFGILHAPEHPARRDCA